MNYLLSLFDSILVRIVFFSVIIYLILLGVNKCLDYRDNVKKTNKRYDRFNKSNYKGKPKPKIKNRKNKMK